LVPSTKDHPSRVSHVHSHANDSAFHFFMGAPAHPFHVLLAAVATTSEATEDRRERYHQPSSSPPNNSDTSDSSCQNRECTNAAGYEKKPNSIYCSSKCQSRGTSSLLLLLSSIANIPPEQNLRQGRVKNVRKQPGPDSPILKQVRVSPLAIARGTRSLSPLPVSASPTTTVFRSFSSHLERSTAVQTHRPASVPVPLSKHDIKFLLS
jgi:hypothetical protein